MTEKLEQRVENPLEELVGQVPFFEGKDFGINPKLSYSHAVDSGEFTGNADDLFDVEEYLQKLANKQPVNIDDLIKVAVKYHRGPAKEWDRFLELREEFNQENAASDAANNLLDEGYVQMAKFVDKNRDAVLDKLDAKSLASLVMDPRQPLYDTGDKEYNRFLGLRQRMAEMQEAAKEGDPAAAIAKEITHYMQYVPKGQEEYYAKKQHLVVPKLIRLIQKSIKDAYEGYFKGADGNFDKAKLKAFMEANYKAMEDKIDEMDGDIADRRSEKFNVWDKNLKMPYIELARRAYAIEKGPYEEKVDPTGKAHERDIHSIGGST